MARALVFPGQGSQFVGMGLEVVDAFVEARHVFEEVDDALGEKLSKVIFEGPIEELTNTQNTQPALMAVSIAIMRVIEKQSGKSLVDLCEYVAGHSLGEYSALCAAGAISLADTARVLRIRGNAMSDAVPVGEGGMAALIGVDFAKAQEIASSVAEVGVCQAANDNGGGQVVVSGAMKAIDRVVEVAPDLGARKAVKLPVSAPFHSQLMEPAAEIMRDALASIEINVPCVPVVANVTADQVVDVEQIRELLVQQVTGMVRWRESMIYLGKIGVDEVVEVGAGKVLSGLLRRIDKGMGAVSIQVPEDIEGFLKMVS